MAELKTQKNNANVKAFIQAIDNEQRKQDANTLLNLFEEVTKQKAVMWGTSIIGFGQYHYKSERSTQEGDWPLTGFSPRKQATTIYIMNGFTSYTKLLENFGPHKTSVSCLYIKKLSDIDLNILKKIITSSYQDMKKKYATSQ